MLLVPTPEIIAMAFVVPVAPESKINTIQNVIFVCSSVPEMATLELTPARAATCAGR